MAWGNFGAACCRVLRSRLFAVRTVVQLVPETGADVGSLRQGNGACLRQEREGSDGEGGEKYACVEVLGICQSSLLIHRFQDSHRRLAVKHFCEDKMSG